MPNVTNFCITINSPAAPPTVGQNYNVTGATIGGVAGLLGTLLNQSSGSNTNLPGSRFTGTFPGMWSLTLFSSELGSTAGTNLRLSVTDNATPINCIATQSFTLNPASGTGTMMGLMMATPTMAAAPVGGSDRGTTGGSTTSRAPSRAAAKGKSAPKKPATGKKKPK